MAELVTARTYLDVVEAEAARSALKQAGIRAFVFEPTAYNPLLTAAAGGIQLNVAEPDLHRAKRLLDALAGPVPEDDEDEPQEGPHGPHAYRSSAEAPREVRCPRCELAYCFHERTRSFGRSLHPLALLFWLPRALFGKKRWHCHTCGHEWDSAEEGPRSRTRLPKDLPEPVFRLRRSYGAAGFFFGFWLGFLIAVILRSVPAGVAFAAAPIVLGLAGSRLHRDLCSAPTCRAPLPAGADECPSCKGTVAGVIERAEQHYAAVAEVRRELARAMGERA